MSIIALGNITWRIFLSFITAFLVPIHYLILGGLLSNQFRPGLFVFMTLNSLGKISSGIFILIVNFNFYPL